MSRPGAALLAGHSAFSGQRPLYILGLNPGGISTETVSSHIATCRQNTDAWSGYTDSWENKPGGTHGLQPAVLHMLKTLKLHPHEVPASNAIFVRSQTEAGLKRETAKLFDLCWAVHQAIIDTLGVKVIVCFGGTAGRLVRKRLGANDLIDQFSETNNRGWASYLHRAPSGLAVATLTHPGRADWRNPAADPTHLVTRALKL